MKRWQGHSEKEIVAFLITLQSLCIFQINNKDNSSISLTQDVLDTLTADLAHELVRPDPKYQRFCQGRKLQTFDFILYPGYQAIINFKSEKQMKA